MRVALDTNILVYAEGLGDEWRCAAARSAIAQVSGGHLFIPTQALVELFNVLTWKGAVDASEAGQRVRRWQAIGYAVPTDPELLDDAMLLSARHQLRIWDAVILAAAAARRCAALLSEDMHHGPMWRGTTVVNPFRTAH